VYRTTGSLSHDGGVQAQLPVLAFELLEPVMLGDCQAIALPAIDFGGLVFTYWP
jgi:hypothetical protein